MAAQALANTARFSAIRSSTFPTAAVDSFIPARPSLLCKCAIASSSRSSDRQVEPPNLPELCGKARLWLTPEEITDFTPKIASVVDWFAQLQDVDVKNVMPAIRIGELEGETTLRSDVPIIFQEREAMLAATPDREGPYLKVPKILRESVE